MFRLPSLTTLALLITLPAAGAAAQQTSPTVQESVSAPSRPPVQTAPAYPPLAQDPLQTPLRQGYHRHDGFFLRMTAGIGGGATSYRQRATSGGAQSVRRAGAGAMFDVAVGYALAENFILHASLSLSGMSAEQRGRQRRESDDDLETVLGFFGGGLTYYFMPMDLYLTGSIGAGGLSQVRGPRHEEVESDTGFGTSVGLGKEWWIGPSGQWALGVALNSTYYRAPLELDGIKSHFHGHVTGLALSATYN